MTTASPHTPPKARLRLLLAGGVSFSVQVVERVGLVDLFRAVFAEEVGGFGSFAPDGHI